MQARRSIFVALFVTTLTTMTFAAARASEPAPPSTQPAAVTGNPMQPRIKLVTSLGDIVLELDGDKAPVSTENFIRYCDEGHYAGTIFHRVMKDFMIQGGGYLPNLAEKTQGLHEPIKNEWKNGLKNARGTIAMARTPEPDSATAQFFINVVDNASLDQPNGGAAYAVFGKVVEGMDVVDKIRNTPVKDDARLPMGTVVPAEPVLIKSAKLVGPCNREKIAALSKAVGKPPAPPAWKKKLDEARQAFGACRAADAAAKSAPEDKREAATKEAARLLEVAKVAEADLMKAAAEDAEKEIQERVAKLEKETGKKFDKTASGLRSTVLTPGTGASPKPTDTVVVHYTGWLLDGTKFDSSLDRGQPAEFPLNGVIKGWTEGVGLMKVGEKRKFVIPPELAYHFRPPPGSNIPPNAVLIFDVELLSIK